MFMSELAYLQRFNISNISLNYVHIGSSEGFQFPGSFCAADKGKNDIIWGSTELFNKLELNMLSEYDIFMRKYIT